MSKQLFWPVLVALLLFWLLSIAVHAQTTPLSLVYLAPRPDATLVSAYTTIAIRPGPPLRVETVSRHLVQVQGSASGWHSGDISLASDHKTVIFRPDNPFAPAERVTVTVQNGLQTITGEAVAGTVFSFTVSPKAITEQTQVRPSRLFAADMQPAESARALRPAPQLQQTQYHTISGALPPLTVTVAANGTGDGYLFFATFTLQSFDNAYMMIVDNRGEPVYYRQGAATDFKRQANGLLTFYDWDDNVFYALDSTYRITDTYQAGHGYQIDFHELQLLPNGNALLMSYDPQPVDMSEIAPGGLPTATVIGLVIQELDPQKNVVFEWRSWDYIPIIDTVVALTSPQIDYVHGNALEVDKDGNILLSSRHLNEITKINRTTGAIIWRLGGKHNQFTFVKDASAPFALQHDIRRLDNGHITLFDNRTGPPSRAVEYALDETKRTATLVWSYSSAPDAHAFIVGNTQRLPNGNTVIGWNSTWPTLTEIKADGAKVFELTLAPPDMTYRALRFPWHGKPFWPPTLVVEEGKSTALYYSWNGATDILYYRIYGGRTTGADTIIDVQKKSGFENTLDISSFLDRYCFFRVMPIDQQGNTTQFSNIVFAGRSCQRIYLPMITRL